jgi:hypothetical protein
VVLKNHARGLDLSDWDQTRDLNLANNLLPKQRVLPPNSLPANSAGNFKQQTSRALKSALTQRVRSARLACGLAGVRRRDRKKINVKRVNC